MFVQIRRCVYILLVLACVCGAQTLPEILAKALDAQGGEDAVKAVRTIHIRGIMENPDEGLTISMTVYRKRPDMIRQELEVFGNKIIRGSDGVDFWTIHPDFGPDAIKMPERMKKDFARDTDMDGPLYDMEEKGITAELLGMELVAERQCHRVRFTYSDGNSYESYFAVDTGDYLKKVDGSLESCFSDFRTVSGVRIPFCTELMMGDSARRSIKLDSVEVNIEIEDWLFSRPILRQ